MSATASDTLCKRAQLYTTAGALGIWLLFTGIQWFLWLLNRAISPGTVERLNQAWFVVAGILTIGIILKQKPAIFAASSFTLNLQDFLIVASIGYLDVNLRFLVLTPPFESGFAPLLKMTVVIGILPVIEELICRGVVVASLLQRMHPASVIIVSSAVFAFFHIDFWPAFVAEVFISLVYILRRRSLAVAIVYHILGNTLVWFPKFIIAAHFRHFV